MSNFRCPECLIGFPEWPDNESNLHLFKAMNFLGFELETTESELKRLLSVMEGLSFEFLEETAI
ncbi:hypothetical protein V2J09_012498 [Rumex salicifolius]